MRSVIQEASSLAKAIEQGWIKAGKPKDFTVKIFEEAEKNFLGLTTKNAKVGIFIDERTTRGEHRPRKHVPQRRRHHRQDQWRRPNQERQTSGQDQNNTTQERPRQNNTPDQYTGLPEDTSEE